MFDRYNFTLFETTDKDVEPVFDAFVAMHDERSKGVRVLVQ